MSQIKAQGLTASTKEKGSTKEQRTAESEGAGPPSPTRKGAKGGKAAVDNSDKAAASVNLKQQKRLQV